MDQSTRWSITESRLLLKPLMTWENEPQERPAVKALAVANQMRWSHTFWKEGKHFSLHEEIPECSKAWAICKLKMTGLSLPLKCTRYVIKTIWSCNFQNFSREHTRTPYQARARCLLLKPCCLHITQNHFDWAGNESSLVIKNLLESCNVISLLIKIWEYLDWRKIIPVMASSIFIYIHG